MLKLIISGCNGYMGKVLTGIGEADADVKIVAGIDISTVQTHSYPVFASPSDLAERGQDIDFDVLIDFSAPSAIDGLLTLGISEKKPLVLCATGYSAEQIEAIGEASKSIPVFRSANMSVGINLLAELIERSCAVLGESFDVEIVERHHRRKTDAPSGTALLLADAASNALPYEPGYVYERASSNKPREAGTIGISSVRGGTIVGVHDVIFAGQDEVIELRHTATSRDVFAVGALRAAKWIVDRKPGLYSMKNVLGRV